MPSLTHVCIWSDNKWQHISAEDAARLHPGGTVSAHSGLFMCELCGQYVTLVDGDRMARHFRHSAAEKSKDCPERTFGSGYVAYYKSNEFDLPLRIVDVTDSSFRLELGLIKIPDELYSNNIRVTITFPHVANMRFTYSGERLNMGGVTYLNVGDIPRESYNLSISNCDRKIFQFWPKEVNGVNPIGSLFEKSSGKKLGNDADVVIGKTYYLLTKSTISKQSKHIRVVKVCEKKIEWSTWKIYEVEALDYDEATARFFLAYHCRLTEDPIEIHPIWPVTVQGPYVVKHREDNLTIYFKGNATAHVFPETNVRSFRNGKLLEVSCNSRQQLISAGRARALQYTYFWKDRLIFPPSEPFISIKDTSGADITVGENYQLPANRWLQVTSPFDGYVVRSTKNRIFEKRRLKANTPTELDKLRFGENITVIVGCDCLANISFVEKNPSKDTNEDALLSELINAGGDIMPVSHMLGNLVLQVKDYPKIINWLYSCIRKGYISENAYRKLQQYILANNNSAKENQK